MDSTEIYELVYDAVKQALADENAGAKPVFLGGWRMANCFFGTVPEKTSK